MKKRKIIIGSRSSPLAMVQSRYVMEKLMKAHPSYDFEIRTIKTAGDKVLDVALSKIGGKGLFTKEIDESLLNRDIDIAVHSMKDIPTELPAGIIIAAVPGREDPRDVIISKEAFTLKTLPGGATVGTSSLRRRAQLLNIRKDLKTPDLRGNLDTRINKMEQGQYDAIMLAYAGIKRLGRSVKLSAISTEEILPQAGQGALGIEVRGGDMELADMVRLLDDRDCHLTVDGERALLAGLEGGCQVPIGVCADISGSEVRIRAGVFSLDGNEAVREDITGNKDEARELGKKLAGKMLKEGPVRRILEAVRREGVK